MKTGMVSTMMVLAMLYYFSMHSLATTSKDEIPSCLQKIIDCIEDNEDDKTNPKLDRESPEFDVKDYVCCSLMQQTVMSEKQCFCNFPEGTDIFLTMVDMTILKTLLPDDGGFKTSKILRLCNVVDDSVSSLTAFCKGSSVESVTSLTTTKPSTNTNTAQGRRANSLMALLFSILTCLWKAIM